MSEKFDKMLEKNITSEMSFPNITYKITGYPNFTVRSVIESDVAKSEWHIKCNDESSMEAVVDYFKTHLNSCIVELIDPENVLHLEYPIVITTESSLVRDSMDDIFLSISQDIIKGV
jgi:hypothetical protein